jgi:hypothetical protein
MRPLSGQAMSCGVAIPSMLALALLVTSCGDDGQDRNAATIASAAFELSGSGKHKQLTGPSSIEAGLVRLTFKNSTTERGGVQLFRGTAGHSGAEARDAAAAWGDRGKPLPNWVKVEGGTPMSAKATPARPSSGSPPVTTWRSTSTPTRERR